MAYALFIAAGLVPVLLAASRLRWRRKRPVPALALSPVSRQHLHLFQGGRLSPVALESTKAQLRPLLERNALDEVEARLRPGMHFVVQVRALAELGTPTAGTVLERQFGRRLSDDPVELSWYWIDLAHGLRHLNRPESLPAILHWSQTAGELPLGHLFAAEVVTCPGFETQLRQPQTPLGRAAMRLLHQAMEGLRAGVPARWVGEARLGEAVRTLWEERAVTPDPLLVRVLVEAQRQVRRAEHTEAKLLADAGERSAFRAQIEQVQELTRPFRRYLKVAGPQLAVALRTAPASERAELLHALNDLRADAGAELLPLLDASDFGPRALAVTVLAWSRDLRIGPKLCAWATQGLRRRPGGRRWWRRVGGRRGGTPGEVAVYRACLRSLRAHPSAEAEAVLLWAARTGTLEDRVAALRSLGWWEPVRRREMLRCLQQGRRHLSAEMRQAAQGALARLGERQALQWFRQALAGEPSPRVHQAIRQVAEEGLTWLWPDLDTLADAEDAEVAFHAREALERLREDIRKDEG